METKATNQRDGVAGKLIRDAHHGQKLRGELSMLPKSSVPQSVNPTTTTRQVPTMDFWGKFDLTKIGEKNVGYSIEDIEHTLSTVGVECNTQVSVDQRPADRATC